MQDKHRRILNPGFVGNNTKKTTHSLTQSKSVAFGVFSFDQTACFTKETRHLLSCFKLTHALIGVSFESEHNLHAVPRENIFCKFIAKYMVANYKRVVNTLSNSQTLCTESFIT